MIAGNPEIDATIDAVRNMVDCETNAKDKRELIAELDRVIHPVAMRIRSNEQVEANEIKRIQSALNWALTVRQLDSTIAKPIDDFIDEIEKVVENFKKRLHNGD